MTPAEQNIINAKEAHIDAINNAIDAIINLEDFCILSNPLISALSKLNSMRHCAETEINVGERVYDSFNKIEVIVSEIHTLNYFLENGESVGRKYCFPVAI